MASLSVRAGQLKPVRKDVPFSAATTEENKRKKARGRTDAAPRKRAGTFVMTKATKRRSIGVVKMVSQTWNQSDDKNTSNKALGLLQSDTIPYDKTHALIVCSTHNFTAGLVLLWEKMGMYEDVLRFWMDREVHGQDPEASSQVLRYLELYGSSHQHLYPLVLRFLTQSPELLSRHTDDLAKILEHIEAEKIMSPIAVVQVLSRNSSASVGLVKKWLMSRIKASQDEIQTDRQLIASYREETRSKLRRVAELSNPEQPVIFHVTRCSQCGKQLELPVVHFMCNHSYHDSCMTDNEMECPICARSHGVIREIRRNNEQLAGQHDVFLSEVKENGFSAVANGFGRGWMKLPRPDEAAV